MAWGWFMAGGNISLNKGCLKSDVAAGFITEGHWHGKGSYYFIWVDPDGDAG